MIKRFMCFLYGHERATKGRRLFYTESDLTEITLLHEYLCCRCDYWIKI